MMTQNWAKVRNYKCFGEEPQGFDDIKRFNVIIGRNNAGKSSLLDLVAFLCKPHRLPALRSGVGPEVLQMGRVDDADHRRVFPADTSRSDIGRLDLYGMKYVNKVMTWRINERGVNEFISIDAPPMDGAFRSAIVYGKTHPLLGKVSSDCRLNVTYDLKRVLRSSSYLKQVPVRQTSFSGT